MSEVEQPTRRGFIVLATLAGSSLLVGCSKEDMMGEVLSFGAGTPVGPFGPFVKIAPDGVVTLISKHQEMGQGNHLGLCTILAEEMDADIAAMKFEHAPANASLYRNFLMGVQGTGGSTAIANSWMQLRKVGAATRAMFVAAAARTWNVPAAEVTVQKGVVAHPSGKSAGFGELLQAAAQIEPPQDPPLKDPKNFTLIGTNLPRRKDSLEKSSGTARYTQDVHMPEMLVAVVAHPPLFGARPKSFDAGAARTVPGVVDVVQISTGVAVLARDTYAAIQGRDALKVTWDESKAERRGSQALLAYYKEIAAGRHGDVTAVPFESKGEAAAFGGELLDFAYDFPYLAHAAMEPMNCVAMVSGRRCRLVTGSQVQSLDQLNTAMTLWTLPGKVEIETLFAGGSFGRRANQNSDYVVECVEIAKQIGNWRPIKLVWTREDDMTRGKYRPLAHHAIGIRVGADGYPEAWRHRIVVQSIKAEMPGAPDFDDSTAEGAMGSPYLKACPAVDGQVYMPRVGIPVLWWRSVGHTHTAMAMEHTIDRLARRAGRDPADYRRALYAKAGAQGQRHLAALDLAIAKSGYGAPLADGWVHGLAVHESFGSVVAQVAEVKLISGVPRVRRVVSAVDCGIAIVPDQVAAQMEGAICYGLSAALFGSITLTDGKVDQTNFDSYRVLRMNEAPLVETHIVPSANPPSGIGEPGTPPIAPAVANALLAISGEPVASLPLVKPA